MGARSRRYRLCLTTSFGTAFLARFDVHTDDLPAEGVELAQAA